MSDQTPTEIELIRSAEKALADSLPSTWTLRLAAERSGRDRRSAAAIAIAAPDGTEALVVLEVKRRIDPKDVRRIHDSVGDRRQVGQGAQAMVVAPWLSPRTREELELAGLGYCDPTGNLWLALDRPAVLLRTTGAGSNPRPEARPLRSLRGGRSGRVVRALLDLDGQFTLGALAEQAGVPAPTASRVVALLDRDAVLEKTEQGRSVVIEAIDKPKLVRRWADDYGVLKSNSAVRALAPRGVRSVEDELRRANWPYALTGSLAASKLAPIAPPRLAMIYVEDQLAAEHDIELLRSDEGANVLLLDPYDSVALERTWERNGLRYAAPAQVAADLLTSPGRGPSEAEQLIRWMEERGVWRA